MSKKQKQQNELNLMALREGQKQQVISEDLGTGITVRKIDGVEVECFSIGSGQCNTEPFKSRAGAKSSLVGGRR